MRVWMQWLRHISQQCWTDGPDIIARFIDLVKGLPLIVGSLRAKRMRTEQVASICMLLQDAVGDSLMVGSTINDFRQRHPTAKIKLASAARNFDMLQLLPPVDSIIAVDMKRLRDSIAIIRREEFDLFIDFTPWSRMGALLAMWSGAKWTAGYKTAGQHRHYAYDCAVLHRDDCHEIENVRALAQACGVASHQNPAVRCAPLPDDIDGAVQNPFIVFHPWPSGAHAALRRWSDDKWVALADDVIARGYNILVTGSSTDKEAAAKLIAQMNGSNRIHNVVGRCDLPQLATLLGQAACVVSVNTGVMHLAAAVDTPLIALHGPTSVTRWGPLNEKAINVISPLPGSGYLDLGFEFNWRGKNYMDGISVDMVRNAIASLAVKQTATRAVQC